MTVDLASARTPHGMRIYAIGDVHGYAGLLKAMHACIDADLKARPPADWRIIHIGDYVDRGPDSKRVIDFLIARMATDHRILALRGNHDQGMLDFLQAPDPFGMFATNGGDRTARSYGVDLSFDGEEAFQQTARLFSAAVPAMHTRFLAERPYSAGFGDYYFCHAGIQPGVPLAGQRPEALMWIRDAFLGCDHLHEKVIIHGHTPEDEVDFRANRINIDTGVYLRQKLSSLVLEDDERSVLTVYQD